MFTLTYPASGKFFYATMKSAGFDIAAAHDAVIPPLQWRTIETGLVITECTVISLILFGQKVIPELQIRSRSGMAMMYGITVLGGICTIDADYRLPIKVPLHNASQMPYTVKAGDRIAQGVVALTLRLDSFETLNVERKGGLGSTGR